MRGILPVCSAGKTLGSLPVAPEAVQIRGGGFGFARHVVVVPQRLAVDPEDSGGHARMGGMARRRGRAERMAETMRPEREPEALLRGLKDETADSSNRQRIAMDGEPEGGMVSLACQNRPEFVQIALDTRRQAQRQIVCMFASGSSCRLPER
jgi:hypothetical protein